MIKHGKDHQAPKAVTESSKVMRLYEDLCGQPKVEFPLQPAQIVAPSSQGVYVIRDRDGTVAHVGKTTRAKSGLDQRLRDHMVGRTAFVIWHLNKNWKLLRGCYTFQFIEVADARSRFFLEALAIGLLCPGYIGFSDMSTGEEKF